MLMPLGGWSFSEDGDEVVIHEDGKSHGYKVPSKAKIDAEILKIEHNEPILYELSELDKKVPRAVEDLIIKDGSDSYLVGKANEKKILRSKLK